jgi:ArsR family transcriptional regulator
MTRGSEIEATVSLLKAVANPVRWVILNRLASAPSMVGGLVTVTGESQSAVSQHLQMLRQAGLVSSVKHSTWREYSLSPGVIQFLQDARALTLQLNAQE